MASIIISKPERPQPIYGFNNVTNGDEVKALIKKIRKEQEAKGNLNKVRIFVLSGTHGDEKGNLVGEDDFYKEDKLGELQTATAVKVNQDTPKNTWSKYFGMTNSILILAWCYSDRWSGLKIYNS